MSSRARRSLVCAPQLLTAGGHRQSLTAIMQVCERARYDTHTTAKLPNRISLCTPLIKRYVTVWGRCALGRCVAAVLGKENSLGHTDHFSGSLELCLRI